MQSHIQMKCFHRESLENVPHSFLFVLLHFYPRHHFPAKRFSASVPFTLHLSPTLFRTLPGKQNILQDTSRLYQTLGLALTHQNSLKIPTNWFMVFQNSSGLVQDISRSLDSFRFVTTSLTLFPSSPNFYDRLRLFTTLLKLRFFQASSRFIKTLPV